MIKKIIKKNSSIISSSQEFISLNNTKYNHHQKLSQLDIEELKKFAAVNLLVEATTSTGTAAGATAIQDQDVST